MCCRFIIEFTQWSYIKKKIVEKRNRQLITYSSMVNSYLHSLFFECISLQWFEYLCKLYMIWLKQKVSVMENCLDS